MSRDTTHPPIKSQSSHHTLHHQHFLQSPFSRPMNSSSGSSFFRLLLLYILSVVGGMYAGDDDMGSFHKSSGLVSPKKLQMFVDVLPDMPKLQGYGMTDGFPVPGFLTVGMFQKKWRFHRDLPLTTVFAYGTSKTTATVPGPTIESLQGIMTRVKWENHLPEKHILPWDPTITTAETPKQYGGVPTVVHLHGAITAPSSDGNSMAWFTKDFNWTGPNWSRKVNSYPNVQPPGNLWYHDHAMGLTRVNLLAGLVGAYVVRDPKVEDPLDLPSGPEFDRHLIVFDRSFRVDGSIYMNFTGNNPNIHPQWQPEYFGDAIIVNGKAWPKLQVQRRKYRFRILNASNARFFRFFFANSNLHFTHVGSDSLYLSRPRKSKNFVLAPSELADVVVDFSESTSDEVVLSNDAPFPYPTGDPTDEINGKVMKFAIEKKEPAESDKSRVPLTLLQYPKPNVALAARKKRYVAMYEYQSSTEEPTHLYLNGKPYSSPVTETPTVGSSEVWDVINLTEDNHPLHVHLGLFVVLEQRSLRNAEKIKKCMMTLNDAVRCHVEEEAVGRKTPVPGYERGWKNVYKMQPGYITRIVVRFSLLEPDPNATFAYPFDATAEPGYVYHCHILDHEDNEMMRPLKLKSGDHHTRTG